MSDTVKTVVSTRILISKSILGHSVRRQRLIHATIRIFTKHLSPLTSRGVHKIISRNPTLTICPLSAASGYEFLCLATVNIRTVIFGIIGGLRIRERDNIPISLFPRNDYVTGPQFTHDAYWIRIRIRGTKSKFFLSTVSGCGVILTFTTCLLSAASGHESFCLATVFRNYRWIADP